MRAERAGEAVEWVREGEGVVVGGERERIEERRKVACEKSNFKSLILRIRMRPRRTEGGLCVQGDVIVHDLDRLNGGSVLLVLGKC